MADDGGYSYARPDVEEIDEPDPTFDVLTDYTVDLDNPLGVGGFGSVHFGCQRSTHKMVAVKAVSKARTRQAAERGAAHTSAEDILKIEIEVMRDLSETRHRNMCARRPPAARPKQAAAADGRRLPAAAIPPPPLHPLPAAIPPPPPRTRVASRPAQFHRVTPHPTSRPTLRPTPRPPHTPRLAAPRVRSPKFYGCGEDDLYMYLILQLCTGGELQDWLLRRSEQVAYTEQTAAKVAYDVLQVPTHAPTHTRTRCARACTACQHLMCPRPLD